MIIVGVGCRKGATDTAIASAVRVAIAQTGLSFEQVSALAAPAFKAGEDGLRRAADGMRLPLHLVERAQLEAVQPSCTTYSPTAMTALGLGSVCEAAAIAEAGAGAILVLPKTVVHGVACAVAEGSME
ncbi:MAG: cobalamin biosynthesis protein [Rhodospirillaceae bacterium]|nr:cobalamin biosynthesis protein [Rhodospirillaceae bacterium]